MFTEREIHILRHAGDLIFKGLAKVKLTYHMIDRLGDRSETFELNDISFTLAEFVRLHRERLTHHAAEGLQWKGTIKDHRNRLNIVFDFNGQFQGFFNLVTIIRMNPDQFKADEPWREHEWVHLR